MKNTLFGRWRKALPLLLLTATTLDAVAQGSIAGSSPQMSLAVQARKLFDDRDFDRADSAYAALVRADPTSGDALFHLGRLALRRGDAEQSVNLLERAAALAPDRGNIQQWLGRAYADQALRGNKLKLLFVVRRAKTAFERSVSLDPDNVDAHADLLQVYLVLPRLLGGDRDRARAEANEIAKRNALRGHLARAGIFWHQKDTAQAEAEYRKAIAAAPDSGAGYQAIALLERETGRYASSLADLECARERSADEPSISYDIGRTVALAGIDLARGVSALRAYLESRPREGDPSFASAHYWLGRVHARAARWAEAAAEYREALRLDPGHRAARRELDALDGSGGRV